MIELTDKEYFTLRDYMLNRFGVDLSKKRALIQGRLSATLQQKGFTNYTDYIRFVMDDKSGGEVNALLNMLVTSHTYFMREEDHFEFLREVALPQFDQSGRRELRAWSAGCSSGEEPYTLAMTLADYYAGKPNPPKLTILAFDISQKALASAQRAVYPLQSLKGLPRSWEQKYFEPMGPDSVRVRENIRALVTFRAVNLMDPFRFKAPFEIVFCRNVMVYFEKERKADLINRLYQWVAPGFYFFISHSENIDCERTKFRMVKPSVYHRDN